MSKLGNDLKPADETAGERDAGHLLSCLEFAWNCLASHGLLEQAKQLAERVDSQRFARLSQAGAGGGVVRSGADMIKRHRFALHEDGNCAEIDSNGLAEEIDAALAALAPSPSAGVALVNEHLKPDFADDGNCCAGKLAPSPATPVQLTASVEAVLSAYEEQTRALPLGAASREKGDSAYNWRMSVVRDLRKLAASLTPAPTQGDGA